MGTWHQDLTPVPLWHETKWTVVYDPPHACRTLMRFDTPEGATDYMDKLIENGYSHCYILQPASIYK